MSRGEAEVRAKSGNVVVVTGGSGFGGDVEGGPEGGADGEGGVDGQDGDCKVLLLK